MRILQIHNSYRQPGGEDMSVAAEATILREAGHDVRRFVIPNPERPMETLVALARAPRNRSAARRVLEAAREFRPDVAHVNNTWFALSPAVVEALSGAGIPTVVTLRNYRISCMQGLVFRDGGVCVKCVGASPLPGIRHRCYRGSLPLSMIAAATISSVKRRGAWESADRLLALSESAKRMLSDAGLDPDRIDVVPNAVLDPGPRSKPPSQSDRILFVGRLVPEKGPHLLLNAWRRLTDRRGLELVLIGDGPLRPALERRLPAGVKVLGWRDPEFVREQMLTARALVFPAQSLEPFGRGAVEAFAAGLPVLGSNLGATTEVVSLLGPDWLVAPHDRNGWASAIASLSHGERADTAGVRARQAYERSFTPQITLTRLQSAYAEAIRDRRR